MTTDIWNGAGRRIYMQEVGPRDGLQVEPAFVPTAAKIALVDVLSEAGIAKIEVTAFVSPKAIPALRDAEIVLREVRRKPGVVYSALVPNVRGAERAIESRADELNLVMSASESHNLSNLRMTRAQSFAALAEAAEIVHALSLMGYDTGVDLGRLIDAARRLPGLIKHDIPSQIVKAGRRLDLHQRPADFDEIRARALARQPAPDAGHKLTVA